MKSRTLTLLSLSLLAFTLFTTARTYTQPSVVRADWVLIDSGSFEEDVDTYTIVYTYWTDFTAGQRIQLDWSTGIIGVHFLILSEANFNAYINSQFAYVELSTDGGSAVTVIWHVPYNGETWYAAWHNRGFIPTHLTCTWYQFEWEGPPPPWYTDPFLLGVVIIVVIVLLGLVVCVIRRYRRRIPKG